MEELTERQRQVIAVAAAVRGATSRELSSVVMRRLGVTVRAYRTELATALEHPDGAALLDQSSASAPEPLAEELLDVLLFEASWRPGDGTKVDAIRQRFGFSMTAYRSRLFRALDHPQAAVIAPRLVAAHAQRLVPGRGGRPRKVAAPPE